MMATSSSPATPTMNTAGGEGPINNPSADPMADSQSQDDQQQQQSSPSSSSSSSSTPLRPPPPPPTPATPAPTPSPTTSETSSSSSSSASAASISAVTAAASASTPPAPQTPVAKTSYWNITSTWFEEAQKKTKELAGKAQEMAGKAQEIAEIQLKVAQEKAKELATKANEIRQTYDMELATSILKTIGGPSDTSLSSANKKSGTVAPKKSVLDLVYVTENVISMAFPYDVKKPGNAEGGNDINVISRFLKQRHSGHYMIWNVSEEPYDYSLFGDQVLEYKFPGHPAPPLGLLFKICTSVESWLDADERNVAVVHCLTGKGRTAALVSCILTWIGEFSSPMEALQYVAERRGISVDFLTIPSQRRYVQYFSNMLDGVKPRSEPLLLRRVIMNSIPVFGDNSGGEANNGCCPYVQLFKCGKLIATAAPPTSSDGTNHEGGSTSSSGSGSGSGGNGGGDRRLELKWIKSSEGCVSFTVDSAVQGDILLRCRHAESSGGRVSMFRAAFHTGYVPCGVLRLTRAQLDGACSDTRFDDEFFIDLIFAPIEKAGAGGVGAVSGATAVPSDSGLVIDATSADKYEAGLHRDTRFWDAVSARKTKSKKRRSRKYVSSTADQFSISDEAVAGFSVDDAESESIRFSASEVPTAAMGGGGGGVAGMSDMELIMQLARAEEDRLGDSLDGEETGAGVKVGGSERGVGREVGKEGLEGSASSAGTLVGSGPGAAGGMGAVSASSPGVGTPTVAKARVELQALEDLEKELGLDELQTFLDSSKDGKAAAASASTPAGGAGAGAGDGKGISSSTTATATATAVGGSTEAKSATKSAAEEDDNLDELERYLQSLSSK